MNVTTEHSRYGIQRQHVVVSVLLLAVMYLGYLAVIREFPIQVGSPADQIKYGNRNVRWQATSHYSTNLPPKEIDALISLLKDEDLSRRGAAAEYLANLVRSEWHDTSGPCNKPVPAHPSYSPTYKSMLNALTESLINGDLDLDARRSIIGRFHPGNTTGHIPPREVVPVFVKLLKWEESAGRRIDIAKALGIFGPEAEEALPALIVALEDPDPGVRREAAQALVKIGPRAKAALPALRELEMHTVAERVSSIALKDEAVAITVGQTMAEIGPSALPESQTHSAEEQSAGNNAETDSMRCVAEGTISFAGKPIHEVTDVQPTFWFRAEGLGTTAKPSEVQYKDGAFRLYGLAPGLYGMSVNIDVNKDNPWSYPGDYRTFTQFSTGNPTRFNVNVAEIIRLRKPQDNNSEMEGWGARGEKTAWKSPMVFEWDSLGEGVTYRYTVLRWQGGTGRREKTGETTETRVELALPISEPEQYYAFSISGRRDGKPVGMLITHGARGYG